MTAWPNVSSQLSPCFPELPGRHPDLVLRKTDTLYDLLLRACSSSQVGSRPEQAGDHIHTSELSWSALCGRKPICDRVLGSSTWSSKVGSDPDVSSTLDLGDC
jgi:hypothetical protein